MTVSLRPATEADANHVASVLTELGYLLKEPDVRARLGRSLHSHSETGSVVIIASWAPLSQ